MVLTPKYSLWCLEVGLESNTITDTLPFVWLSEEFYSNGDKNLKKKYDVRNIWASCIFLPITKIWKTAQEPLICFLPAYDLGTVGYSSYKVVVYLKKSSWPTIYSGVDNISRMGEASCIISLNMKCTADLWKVRNSTYATLYLWRRPAPNSLGMKLSHIQEWLLTTFNHLI